MDRSARCAAGRRCSTAREWPCCSTSGPSPSCLRPLAGRRALGAVALPPMRTAAQRAPADPVVAASWVGSPKADEPRPGRNHDLVVWDAGPATAQPPSIVVNGGRQAKCDTKMLVRFHRTRRPSRRAYAQPKHADLPIRGPSQTPRALAPPRPSLPTARWSSPQSSPPQPQVWLACP